jgi:hypothetical protein
MTSIRPSQTTSYFGDRFTAPGLPEFKRTITGHKEDGLAYFVVRDNGDNRHVRKAAGFGFEAAEANIYTTFDSPVNLNEDNDLRGSLHEWQVIYHPSLILAITVNSIIYALCRAGTTQRMGHALQFSTSVQARKRRCTVGHLLTTMLFLKGKLTSSSTQER